MTRVQLQVTLWSRYVNLATVVLLVSGLAVPGGRETDLLWCAGSILVANALCQVCAAMTGNWRSAAYFMLGVDGITIGAAIYLTGFVASPFAILITLPFTAAFFIELDRRTVVRFSLGFFVWLSLLFVLWWIRGPATAGWNPREFPGYTRFAFVVQLGTVVGLLLLMTGLVHPLIQNLGRQERELERQAHRAELGASVAMLAHELRSPLTTISFSLHAALDQLKAPEGPGATRALRHLQSSQQELDRINRMLESLLSYAREKRGNIRLEAQHPLALFNRAVEFVQAKRDRTSRRIHVDVETRTGQRVLCDPDAMHQVLVNLVDNAVQHADPARPLRIDLRAIGHGDRVSLLVRDNGTGIPADQLPHIFEQFATRRPGGTGIGLSIARHLVQDQCGTIEFESRVGEGTTFTISLPADGGGTAVQSGETAQEDS